MMCAKGGINWFFLVKMSSFNIYVRNVTIFLAYTYYWHTARTYLWASILSHTGKSSSHLVSSIRLMANFVKPWLVRLYSLPINMKEHRQKDRLRCIISSTNTSNKDSPKHMRLILFTRPLQSECISKDVHPSSRALSMADLIASASNMAASFIIPVGIAHVLTSFPLWSFVAMPNPPLLLFLSIAASVNISVAC